MQFKKLLGTTLCATTLLFSSLSGYTQEVKDNFKKPLPHQEQREVPKRPDNVMFLTDPENFRVLQAAPEDVVRYISSVTDTFNEVFEKEIHDAQTPNSVVAVIVQVKGITNKKEVCEADYTKCVLMGVGFETRGTLTQEKLKEFQDKIMGLKEIPIKNNDPNVTGAFMIYMNVKAEQMQEEFIKEQNQKSFSCKPHKSLDEV